MQRFSWRQTILLVVVLLTLTACGSGFNSGPTPTPFGAYQLSSYFRDLYERLGAEAVIGQAISPLFDRAGIYYQYTENVLFSYNPSAKIEADRISLVAMQTELKLPNTGQQYPIFDGFKATYDSLFGVRYVGKPLSGVRYNKDMRRIEQYFEKMGFYRLIDDPRGTVRLMAYGAFACDKYCPYEGDHSSIVSKLYDSVEVSGLPSFLRLGGFAVFGSPLSWPYKGADGNTEQVFENALVYIPKDNPTTVLLRPLAKDKRVRLEAPTKQDSKPNQAQGTVFYQVGDGVGYAVPVAFDEFIAAHGGKEISGEPTSAAYWAMVNGAKIPGQCFENYCLYYNADAAPGSQVGLMNLGKQFLKEIVNPDDLVFEFSPKTTLLKLSELKPQVSASEQQVIQIIVVQAKDLQPISGVVGVLVVGLPDGSKPAYSVPPTDQNGSASVTLPPIKNAANGTVIPYVVCLNVPSDTKICRAETYFIWNVK